MVAWLPGLWVLRHYDRRWLGRDVAAGLVLTALLVPAGMGYAEAAGLPPITGLYATIGPLIAYAIFGPSRVMVLGPDSGLAAMIAAAVVAPAAGDASRAIALASALALMAGLVCVGAGLFRAGFMAELLSKPVRVGYMNGIALTVLIAQLPKLIGEGATSASVRESLLVLARALGRGDVNVVALAIGVGSLVLILATRALAPKVPAILIAVILATGIVSVFDLSSRVHVVGPVPEGVPTPTIPIVELDDLFNLFVAAIGIALVSFAETSVLSRTFAGRSGYRVDPSRELIGLGAANLAAGLFHGFPISSSSSRTPVAEAAGSRTQVTGVVGALTIVVLLVVAPRLTASLPTVTLAAIVIAAAIAIFDFASLRDFYRVRRSDFSLSIAAFLAVAAFGALRGVGIAVSLSLLDVVRRAWRPHYAILGRAPHVKGYHDVTRYADAKQIPGLLLFRWDAPLFFANADGFRERVLDAVEDSRPAVRWVVVAAEPITDVDTTAAQMIEELDKELAHQGIELAFAELKDPVKDRLDRYGLRERVGRDSFFPTVGVAVKAFLTRHDDVDYRDWEDSRDDGEQSSPAPGSDSDVSSPA